MMKRRVGARPTFKDKMMAKTGRPSKFDGINLDQVKALTVKGWTDLEMAKFFGVVESTWYLWKKEHPEFSEALKGWKDEADAKVERALYERAIGFSHPEEKIFCSEGVITRADTIKQYPPDTTAGIFWLKNRKPEEWRDKQEIEHSGTVKLSSRIAEARKRILNKDDNTE